MALFEAAEEAPPQVKRFVEWTMGSYPTSEHSVKQALASVRSAPFPVTDVPSLASHLVELSTYKPYVYSIQLCSLPKEALPPLEYAPFCEAFHVVVGDTPADVAYFWNRPATIPVWSRTYLTQTWLPVSLATDTTIAPALNRWLHRAAERADYQQNASIRFVSTSLSQERLTEIADSLMRPHRGHRSVVSGLWWKSEGVIIRRS